MLCVVLTKRKWWSSETYWLEPASPWLSMSEKYGIWRVSTLQIIYKLKYISYNWIYNTGKNSCITVMWVVWNGSSTAAETDLDLLLHELLLSAEELQNLLRTGLTVLVQLLQSDKTRTQTELQRDGCFSTVCSEFWDVCWEKSRIGKRFHRKSVKNLLSVKGSFSLIEHSTDYH